MENKFHVTFLNQPKLSGHKVDETLDKARVYLVPKIEKFILNHYIFKGGKINVSFFHTGVSSLVCLIESNSGKYILKIELRPSNINMEASFLKKWEDIGIKVPHIYEAGKIEDYNYILMEYIDEEILLNKYSMEELISKNIFFEMGQNLRKIHTLKSDGFGAWNDNKQAKYKTFKEWVDNDTGTQNQIKYTKENNLLPEEYFGSIDKNIDNLTNYIVNNNQSTYCHFDFSPNNILATEPITIFDPVCLINHPFIDLAKSIIQSIANSKNPIVAQKILDGYFCKNENLINKDFIKSALFFIACKKFPYWHKKQYFETIEVVKDYLRKI